MSFRFTAQGTPSEMGESHGRGVLGSKEYRRTYMAVLSVLRARIISQGHAISHGTVMGNAYSRLRHARNLMLLDHGDDASDLAVRVGNTCHSNLLVNLAILQGHRHLFPSSASGLGVGETAHLLPLRRRRGLRSRPQVLRTRKARSSWQRMRPEPAASVRSRLIASEGHTPPQLRHPNWTLGRLCAR
jgi:hypothetical protein